MHALPKTLAPFLWHFLKKYKLAVLGYVLFSLAAGLWGPLNSILIKNIINLLPLASKGDFSNLRLPAILLVLNFIVFDNITWRALTYIRAKITPLMINSVISDSMSYVLEHSHQFFQDNLSGKLSKQVGNLADGLERLVWNIFSNFLRGGALLCAAFITAYFVNPIFSAILVVWFILFSSASIFMSKRLVAFADKQASTEAIVVGELVDALSNQSNIRLFARRPYEIIRMTPFFNHQKKAYSATYFYALIMHSVQGGLIAAMMGFAIYFLIHLYSQNLVTIGDFALILILSMETGHMMWYTMSEVDDFNKVVGKCKHSMNAIMVPLEIQDKPGAPALECTQGEIEFKNVTFHYKGTQPLFKNQSIKIEPGQKVGLVGYSGGGKSTFVNLILRFYDINQGAILIDGQNIQEVTQDSLRSSIAMIPQDPSLFHRTLMENIRYGRIDATDAEVIEAAKQAHAHEFISKLPEGYNALVGERGIKLSGGQRQRIAIARAILKNTPILILDEATSQLDSVTENLIQESLWQLMQAPPSGMEHSKQSEDIYGKTVLVIAHRLSTLLHMDRILVFDQGQIVEEGTHTQLLAKNGRYKALWTAQVGGFLGDMPKNAED